jgi:hypothetical protein
MTAVDRPIKRPVIEAFLETSQRFGELFLERDKTAEGIRDADKFFQALSGARLAVQAATVRKGMAVEMLEGEIDRLNTRVQDLLEANTAYLLRAREAEAKLKEK